MTRHTSSHCITIQKKEILTLFGMLQQVTHWKYALSAVLSITDPIPRQITMTGKYVIKFIINIRQDSISLSGIITKSRFCISGWGMVSSSVCISRLSYNRMSMSMLRSWYCPPDDLTLRPNWISISLVRRSISSGWKEISYPQEPIFSHFWEIMSIMDITKKTGSIIKTVLILHTIIKQEL